ncbi:hypothetical protein A1O7_08237 [Cladophialophora yegresii CBS 114405]|uniref:Uncharacterized protein n=1 Tax=Cladophialophora yegresii CBS 114405 TaxID=1182544 RepID=W9VQL2_9EURO|nr:uncharacterized protein A1O7_08237 [Cladophialophora yegresii CBS 114405]EXJ55310.1 hypothetical protein A1O7_08237 [Cladophialophora yegresii CBS 114405]
MNRDAILATLKPTPKTEPPDTTSLRHKAHAIISTIDSSTIEQIPATLLDLLTQIIKPLFTRTRHPHLTSTGRKSQVAAPPASIANRFLDTSDGSGFNDPPWKTSTPLTIPLLEYILTSYSALPAEDADTPKDTLRGRTVEAHFHLLVPPILNMIDDAAPTPYKSAGCKFLATLCEVLTSTHSEILKRSGLADVMVDALRTNFLTLPTLTPEEDSLALLGEVYPAFLGVVDARFVVLMRKLGSPSIQAKAQDASAGSDVAKDADFIPYQAMLTLVYRHGIMASLAHLSASSNAGSGSLSNTISVPLTVLLLRQIPPVFSRMGIHSVTHLRGLLPTLRASLMDPFVLAAPDMVGAILDVVDCVCDVARARIQQKWWPEVLRGLIGCWVNCVDEKETIPAGKTAASATHLEDIMARLRRMVKSLGEIVDPNEWSEVKKTLVEEEDDLRALFGD